VEVTDVPPNPARRPDRPRVTAGRAEAVTLRDIIELAERLSDPVLLALEVDRGVFDRYGNLESAQGSASAKR
jgi:hypothetical protein